VIWGALAMIPALVLVAASLAMTLTFAHSLLPAPWCWLFVVVFGSVAALKFLYAIRVHQVGWISGAAVIWAGCFVADTVMVSGFILTAREAVVGERRAAAATRDELVTRVAALRSQTATEPRPRETVAAALGTAERTAGNCGPSRANTDACLSLAGFRDEMAAVTAYERRRTELAAAVAKLDAMPAVVVYPEAHRIAQTIRTNYPTVTDEAVSAAMWLLFALIVDLVPIAVLFSAAARFGERPPPSNSRRPAAAPATPPPASDETLVLHVLRNMAAQSRDGHARAPLRTLAVAANLPVSRVQAALAVLAAAHKIEPKSTKRGQIVRVIN
jgi:hypothetical protein